MTSGGQREEVLLILGASARAAAFSARRAGFAPQTIDLFADLDLARQCPASRVAKYPHGFLAALRGFPQADWMYTGGLENHPQLVDRLAAERPLLGNTGKVLGRVRNPLELSQLLSAGPCRFPEIALTSQGLPTDGSWLRKGYRSSGGIQVQTWDAAVEAAAQSDRGQKNHGYYFQRRVTGLPCAAVFVAAGGNAALLGATEQFVGTDWSHAAAWHYAGSLGPLPLDSDRQSQLEELGQRLAEQFQLTGLFGVDLVLGDETTWLIEVNPRFPASVEVLERSLDIPAVGLHVEACRHAALPATLPKPGAAWHGKVVLFAATGGKIDAAFEQEAIRAMLHEPWPSIADVPRACTPLRAGQPIMTVFAQAADRNSLEAALREQVARWESLTGTT